MNINKKYQELLSEVYYRGFEYEDPNRKGVIRKQIPYHTLEHKFSDGFPIIGLKQTYPKMAFNEMKAFMSGMTNLKQLEDLGVTFWRKDAYNYYLKLCQQDNWIPLEYGEWLEEVKREVNWGTSGVKQRNAGGDLGKIYSHQIRNWNGRIDQLNEVLERLKIEPNSTKNLISMWNPSDMDSCALSACHTRFSLIVENLNWRRYDESPKYGLTIQWNQDSVDTFLGLPINIQYYSFVCYVFANYLGMKPLGILGNLTNCHLYDNSFEAVKELLTFNPDKLEPIEVEFNLPESWTSLDDYLEQLDFNQVGVKNYYHLGKFNVEMLAYSK